MHAPNSENLMPIGAAVELLRAQHPDVTHSSLRFLEREGLVSSTRTDGGHRLYARADIEHILLIKNWQRQGHSLEEIRGFLAERSALKDPALLSRDFLDLGLASQLERAGQLILQADRIGMDPDVIFFDVLQPALARLGEKWANGTASVHQEKEISVLCRELVTEITLRHSVDPLTDTVFISACAPGEKHEIGIIMVNGLLRQRGHRVRYLGPDVATVFLIEAIKANIPKAILLSSTVEESFSGCLKAVDAINEQWPGERSPLIIVGGEIAARHAQELVELGAAPIRDVRMIVRLEELLAPQ